MSESTDNQVSRRHFSTVLALATILFAVSLGLRVYRIDFSSIWMDEDAQAGKILHSPKKTSLVQRAATQHQPPIDYYAEAVFLRLFGITELGARFHAALFGSLASVLFFLLILQIIKRPFLAAFFSLIFVFDSNLIFYSQEGRPIACGVFFSALYLMVTSRFLMHKGSVDSLLVLSSGYFIFATLFLLSVGFQPLVFCGVSFLCALPLFVFRGYRLKVVLLLLLTVAAYITAFPILNLAVEHGGSYIGEGSIAERIVSIFENLGAVSLEGWSGKYSQLLGGYFNYALIVSVIGFIGLMMSRKQVPSRVLLLFLYLVLFVALYPGVYDVMFGALIDYDLKLRYYLTFTPVLFTVIAVFSSFVFLWTDKLIETQRKSIRALPYVLLVAVFFYGSHFNFQQVKTNYTSQKKTDWRSLYQLFKTEGQGGGVAFMMNLVEPKQWHPSFYAKQFYYPKNQPRPVILRNIKSLDRYYKKDSFDRIRRVYFVTAYGHQHLKEEYISALENTSFYKFHRVSIIKIENPQSMRQSIRLLFIVLRDRVKKTPMTHKIFELYDQIVRKKGQ